VDLFTSIGIGTTAILLVILVLGAITEALEEGSQTRPTADDWALLHSWLRDGSTSRR
jgi:hypothetical protein